MATTATEAAKAAPAAAEQANGNGNGNVEQKTRHSEVGHKSLLKSDDLYQVRYTTPLPVLPISSRAVRARMFPAARALWISVVD